MKNNPNFNTYIIINGKIESGWTNRNDARTHAKNNLQDSFFPVNICSINNPNWKKEYPTQFIDPNNDYDWHTEEIIRH
jgi:hypothetical protein